MVKNVSSIYDIIKEKSSLSADTTSLELCLPSFVIKIYNVCPK